MRINPRKFDAANWNPAALDRAGSAHPVAEFSMIPLKGDQPERLAPMFRASPPPLEYCNMFISCIDILANSGRPRRILEFSQNRGTLFLENFRVLFEWLPVAMATTILSGIFVETTCEIFGRRRCADNIFQPQALISRNDYA
jgi:hypothetical protein